MGYRLSRSRIEKLLHRDGDPLSIHLQGIGRVKAKPAREFNVGDDTLWNNGAVEAILSITPKGQTQLTWEVLYKGKKYTRVVKADRLIGIGPIQAQRQSAADHQSAAVVAGE